MGIINLLRALAPLFKDSKTLLGTIAIAAVVAQQGVGYVDARHREGIEKIEETSEEVKAMREREYVTQATLISISHNLSRMNEMLNTMDRRLWELHRDSKQSKIVNLQTQEE